MPSNCPRLRVGLSCTGRQYNVPRVSAIGNSSEYNKVMKEKMQWDKDRLYEYNFDRGLYYHHILEDKLLCGSQPTSSDDIKYLRKAEGCDVIVSLQQEKDPLYWGVDTGALHSAMQQCGLKFIRAEAADFDKHSLRQTLPMAVRHIAKQLNSGKKVYVHCTAGLGRAPAACICYLFWFCDFDLHRAYQHVVSIRPCGPNKDAIRAATFDMCSGRPAHEFGGLPANAFCGVSAEERERLQSMVLG